MSDDLQVPQLAFPLRLDSNGDFAQVEQDSLDDITDSVAVLISTPVGSRIEVPEYGIPDVTFAPGGLDFDATALEDAIQTWEPRAKVTITDQLDSTDDMVNYVLAQVAESNG